MGLLQILRSEEDTSALLQESVHDIPILDSVLIMHGGGWLPI
jgi:hypothetical protein